MTKVKDRYHALNRGARYRFRLDFFNENGATKGIPASQAAEGPPLALRRLNRPLP